MKHTGLLAVFACTALTLLSTGCGKETVAIGKGDPQGEIKECLALSAKGKHEDAIQCFEMFKARYPQTAEGQEAELLIGDSNFARKDYLVAAEAYGAFLRLYPTSPKADYAHYKIGVCYYKESPKAPDRDQEYLGTAIDHLRTVIRRYPNSEYREPAARTLGATLRRIAKRHFYIGRFYYRTGEYIAAAPRFMEVAENYPDSGIADKALYYAVRSNLGLNRIDAAREAYGQMASRYPQSSYTKKAEHKMLRAAKKK
ncbi:MAG: outer membrane protein assembly factor BamD [bacterium]